MTIGCGGPLPWRPAREWGPSTIISTWREVKDSFVKLHPNGVGRGETQRLWTVCRPSPVCGRVSSPLRQGQWTSKLTETRTVTWRPPLPTTSLNQNCGKQQMLQTNNSAGRVASGKKEAESLLQPKRTQCADRSYWRQSGIRLVLTKNKHCGNSNSVGLSGSSRARMPHQDEMRMRPILKNTQIVHFLYWSVKYVGLAAKFTVKGRLKCKDNKIFPEHNFRNVRIQNISTTLRSYSLASRLYRYSSSHNFHLLNQLEYIFKKKQLIAKLQVLKERQLGIFLFCWNW